jgi:hypothetical protein
MYPPSARTSRFSPTRFAADGILPPGCAKSRWRPPPPVRAVGVTGIGPCCDWIAFRPASPSAPSTSSTTRPEPAPVTMPTFASGRDDQKADIRFGSTVASL